MSFAEDNDHDILSDESYFEVLWRQGLHQDKENNEYKISEMTSEHLQNTINYFDDLNTTPLQEELNKRTK